MSIFQSVQTWTISSRIITRDLLPIIFAYLFVWLLSSSYFIDQAAKGKDIGLEGARLSGEDSVTVLLLRDRSKVFEPRSTKITKLDSQVVGNQKVARADISMYNTE